MKKYFNPLADPLFIVCCLLFILSQLLQYSVMEVSFVSSYLDDLLVVPVVLPPILVALRWIFKNPTLQIELGMLITLVLMLSILFEGLLPALNDKYTRDVFDILCYILGALCYWYWNKYFLNKSNYSELKSEI